MVGIRSNYLWCGYGSSTLETGIEFQIVRVADGWESVISFDFYFFSLSFLLLCVCEISSGTSKRLGLAGQGSSALILRGG